MEASKHKANRWNMLIRFFRFEYLSVAVIFPLMGAATSTKPFDGFRLLGILGIAFTFHIYVSILNDIIDLPLDRTNPTRSAYPLVSGKISPAVAWLVVLIMIPAAAAVIYWQSSSPFAYAAMALALGMMTIYNLWGKRSPFPPAIDIIQGIGFSSLALVGAALTGGLTRLSWLVFILGVVWMVLTNLMGGFRDLSSDLAFGVNTTPIFFGVRPSSDTQVAPRFVNYYAYCLQLLMSIGGLILIGWNDLHYPKWLNIGIIFLFVIFSGFALFLLITFFGLMKQNYDKMITIGFRHLGISSGALILLLLPALPIWAALGVIFTSLLTYRDYSVGPLLAYWRKQ
ncbi:MAG: UbiA prenyltransferase family protein [Anaerolineales bacterium]